jgi:hypothetical protein
MQDRTAVLFQTIWRRASGLKRTIRANSKIRRRLDTAPPLLIYQMGKVGSSSLEASLAPTWRGLTIKTHSVIKDKGNREDVRLVYERVIRKGGAIFIISLVREPIERNISAFFENFERETGVKYSDSTFSIDELIHIFLQNYNHDIPLRWFDQNLKPLFDIDVYNYEFPSNGVQIIDDNNTKLLLMRCEVPNCVKESAVRDFLNIPSFSLLGSNVGSQKEYAEAYRKFKEAFIPPDWYVRRMYESRFFNHFYSEMQKNRWIERWTER